MGELIINRSIILLGHFRRPGHHEAVRKSKWLVKGPIDISFDFMREISFGAYLLIKLSSEKYLKVSVVKDIQLHRRASLIKICIISEGVGILNVPDANGECY